MLGYLSKKHNEWGFSSLVPPTFPLFMLLPSCHHGNGQLSRLCRFDMNIAHNEQFRLSAGHSGLLNKS
jgi:hypothetical protein